MDPDFTPPESVSISASLPVPPGYTVQPVDVSGHDIDGDRTQSLSSDEVPRRIGAGRWTAYKHPAVDGCDMSLIVEQHFDTLPLRGVLRAMIQEHSAVRRDAHLPLFEEARLQMRDAHFVDSKRWKRDVLEQGSRVFYALAREVFGAPAAPGTSAAEPSGAPPAVHAALAEVEEQDAEQGTEEQEAPGVEQEEEATPATA